MKTSQDIADKHMQPRPPLGLWPGLTTGEALARRRGEEPAVPDAYHETTLQAIERMR